MLLSAMTIPEGMVKLIPASSISIVCVALPAMFVAALDPASVTPAMFSIPCKKWSPRPQNCLLLGKAFRSYALSVR